MAVDHLWTEWHLTPCGWVSGSVKTELGSTMEVEPPLERVLTCRYDYCENKAHSRPFGRVTELWRSADADRVEMLLALFGNCPENL